MLNIFFPSFSRFFFSLVCLSYISRGLTGAPHNETTRLTWRHVRNIAPSQQLQALGAVYLQRYSATPTLIYLSLRHFANISVGSAEYLCWVACCTHGSQGGVAKAGSPWGTSCHQSLKSSQQPRSEMDRCRSELNNLMILTPILLHYAQSRLSRRDEDPVSMSRPCPFWKVHPVNPAISPFILVSKLLLPNWQILMVSLRSSAVLTLLRTAHRLFRTASVRRFSTESFWLGVASSRYSVARSYRWESLSSLPPVSCIWSSPAPSMCRSGA